MRALLLPARLLDTRPGQTTIDNQQAGTGLANAGTVTKVKVVGRGSVPAASVGSVAVNVTAVSPQTSGYVTVWPTGQTQPTASNLNFTTNQTIPNLVISKVGNDGTISIYTSTTTHLIVDIAGYFPTTSTYVGLQPARLLDTRPGQTTIDNQQAGTGRTNPIQALRVQVAGRGGVPLTGVDVVAVNVTVVDPTSDGYAVAWPWYRQQPVVSNLNYVTGQTIANLVIARVGSDGAISISTTASTHLIVDIAGYIPADPYVPSTVDCATTLSSKGPSRNDGPDIAANILTCSVPDENGATRFSVVARNEGTTTSGPVEITLSGSKAPTGLPTGTGWVCAPNPSVCRYAALVAAGEVLPPLTVNLPRRSSLQASVRTNGDVDYTNDAASARVRPASSDTSDLTVTVSPTAVAAQGDRLSFNAVVKNIGEHVATGTTTMTWLSAGNGIAPNPTASGIGWTCGVDACTRSDALAPGASFPSLALSSSGDYFATDLGATVSVTGEADERDVSNNSATTVYTQLAPKVADLVPMISVPTVPVEGGQATFATTVANRGRASFQRAIEVDLSGLPVNHSSSGTNWTCITDHCTHPGPLAVGATLPPIITTTPVVEPSFLLKADIANLAGSDLRGNGAGRHAETQTQVAGHTPTSQWPLFGVAVEFSGTAAPGNTVTTTVRTRISGQTVTKPVVLTLPQDFAVQNAGGIGWACDIRACTYDHVPSPGEQLNPLSWGRRFESGLDNSGSAGFSVGFDPLYLTGTSFRYQFGFPKEQASISSVVQVDPTPLSGNSATGQILTKVGLADAVVGPIDVYFSATTVNNILSGTGWDCTIANTCRYSGTLSAGASLPPIRFQAPPQANVAYQFAQAGVSAPNDKRIVSSLANTNLWSGNHPSTIGMALNREGPAPYDRPVRGSVLLLLPTTFDPTTPVSVRFDASSLTSNLVALGGVDGWVCDLPARLCTFGGLKVPGQRLPPLNYMVFGDPGVSTPTDWVTIALDTSPV